jgi:hypothetical protein
VIEPQTITVDIAGATAVAVGGSGPSIEVHLPGPTGPPGDSTLGPAPDGSFAIWNANLGAIEFVPSSTVMRTGLGTDADTPPDPPVTIETGAPPALSTLTDAGSYFFPTGISTEDAPVDADPGTAYVLAVTSSPSTDAMAGPPHVELVDSPPPPPYQSGIQILTQLQDPRRVWRRGFSTSEPTVWTDWILSGAAAAGSGMAGIQGSLDDPTQLPPEGSYIGEAYLVAGDLWIWR